MIESVRTVTKGMMEPQFDAVVALGSNVGDKVGNIARAIEILTGPEDVRLVKRSRDFKTPPWGKTDQDWFVNACISVSTDLSARGLLERCLETEVSMGRERREKWGPRVIDLDVLVFRDQTIKENDFVLPHPHITERAFVLAPLADIAPQLSIKGHRVWEWLKDIETEGVEPIVEAQRVE